MPFEADKTYLILLGAASFPLAPEFAGSTALLNAKEKVRRFFVDEYHLDGETQVLDLFDSELDPDSIDTDIYTFITTRKGPLHNLFIYYIGHGTTDGSDAGLILALKRSKSRNLGVSSITARSLGKTLADTARKFRIFLFLDCCFAAQMYTSMQSPVHEYIGIRVRDSFPNTGLTLLCSTAKDNISMIVEKRNITMFTEGLEKALRQGSPDIKTPLLTLRQLGELTYDFIRQDNRDTPIRPEVHTPTMPSGDIADMPLFPNPAFKGSGTDIAYNIELRKKEIENSIIENNLITASRQFVSFVNDFDTDNRFADQKVLLGSRATSLEEPSHTDERYPLYLQRRLAIYGEMVGILNQLYFATRPISGTRLLQLHAEADILRENIRRDLAYYYPDLYDFCRRLSTDPALLQEVILLGSRLTEISESKRVASDGRDTLYSLQDGRDTIYSLGDDAEILIDRILQASSPSNTPLHLRESDRIKHYFLDKKPTQRSVFVCHGIGKRVSKDFRISDLNLDLKLGEITAIIGENGNGKTTVLRLVADDLRASEGQKLYPFFADLGVVDFRNSIGYVREKRNPRGRFASLRQELKFVAAIKGLRGKENERQFDLIITLLGLQKEKDKSWEALSGGFKLRFEIARALIWQPKLLILDEPLAHLDVKSQLFFLNDLRNLTHSIAHSMAVLISTQNLYEVEKIADNIVFIRNGDILYNGKSGDMGRRNTYRCYQIGTARQRVEVERALSGLDILQVRRDAIYVLIYTGEGVSGDQVMTALSDRGIGIDYFRDISNFG